MPDERTPVLLLSTDRSNLGGTPLLRVRFRPAYLTPANELRNYVSSSYDGDPLADLAIDAQADFASENAYGWDVRYRDVYDADLARVEQMVKTLRRIDRGLTRLREQFGYEESFAGYATRVANVLRISRFGWHASGTGSLYTDNEYRWTDASGITARVTQLVAEFHKERKAVSA